MGTNAPTLGTSALSVASAAGFGPASPASPSGDASPSGAASELAPALPFGIDMAPFAGELELLLQPQTPRSHMSIATTQIRSRFISVFRAVARIEATRWRLCLALNPVTHTRGDDALTTLNWDLSSWW